MSSGIADSKALSRRQFLGLAATAAGSAIIASCAPARPAPVGEPTKAVEAPKAEKITFSMWTHDKLYVDFFTFRGETWKQDRPQYEFTFDFQQIPYGEVFTKVLANLAAGSGAPDLVGIEISAFSRFMKGDIAEKGLIDLTDWIGDERAKFVEGRWTPYMHKGKLYGVESALCPVGYWYQPAILEAAGIEMPIKTWDDFVAVGKRLAAEKKTMAPVDDLGQGLFMQLFQQRGGNIFAQDGTVTLDSPEAVEVLQFLVDGANRDKIFLKAGADSYWGAGTFAAYKDGLAAGAIMPDWYLGATLKPQLADMHGQWRLATLPLWQGGGHKTSTWGGTGFAITRHSQHADLVWSLLHYTYMTLESQVLRFQKIHYFPHMIEAFDDPGVTELEEPYCGGQKVGGVFASVARDIPIQWQSPFWNEAMTELTNQCTMAYAGEISPEAAIKAADQSIKAIVERGE
jgi:multiple sugar transport system substrate-binding protein/arabinosaccharide transport system substrate-binding protein